MASNHSWQLFSDNNNGTSDSADVGVNYLEVCKRSHLEDGQFSSKAYDGILSVIRKEVELFELEYPCHSKAEKRWFTLRATPIKNSESLILIMHIDITRRKLYELEREAILEAEQKERDLLSAGEELAKMGTWEWDIHTNKVKVSNNSLQMFGIGQKDYDGSIKGLMKYVHQRDKGNIYEQFERMVSNKKPEPLEFRVSLPDDELRYIKGISKVYLDKEGEVTKLVGINQDITEGKVAEKQLFEAKELVEESE